MAIARVRAVLKGTIGDVATSDREGRDGASPSSTPRRVDTLPKDLHLGHRLATKQNRLSLIVSASNKQLIQDGLQLLRGFG